MKASPTLSRRRFFKSAALTAPFALSGIAAPSCKPGTSACYRPGDHPEFSPLLLDPEAGPTGLLFSQVGYEPGRPVRVVLRRPPDHSIPEGAECRLISAAQKVDYQVPLRYWGEIWDSRWWVAEFPAIPEGVWDVAIADGSSVWAMDAGLRIENDIFWNQTALLSSVDMLERRVHFTKVGAGWQDAGTLWVESPAQSAMIMALEDMLLYAGDRLDDDFRERIYTQICVGCDYLVMTQNKARELGFPEGSMSHDLHGHERDVLPNDAAKAVVALLRAVRLLPDSYAEKRKSYSKAAFPAADWLMNRAVPMGDYSYSRFQRGLPDQAGIPADEWQTRDLIFLCWGALELWLAGMDDARDRCVAYARAIMDRQIGESHAEEGYYGHFREFGSLPHSEKAWAHGIINNQFGADMGGLFPNYLIPLIEMLRLWPDHDEAPSWRKTLEHFAYGYMVPVCSKNPFGLMPLGIFGAEGPIWFCGTFHGTNSVYGYTAALALELYGLFGDGKLAEIAYANMQWLAGLNAGITAEALAMGSVVYSADVPVGVALPASMIYGIGRRWAGSWFATRGVICNGFTTGRQFVYDVEPKKANDGPHSFTDEDWIPHSAGWLSALVRLLKR